MSKVSLNAATAKYADNVTVNDRMDRVPMSKKGLGIMCFVYAGWFAETIDLGGTSFLLPTIREYFNLDATMGGYYTSIAFVGMFIGALCASYLSDKLGRKKVMVGSMFVWGIAAFALIASTTIPYLFTMRFILGVGLGAQMPVAMAYVSEMCCPAQRAKYTTLYQLIIPIGFTVSGFLTVAILPSFSWQGVFLAEAIPSLLIFGLIFVVPESPRWLETRGRLEEADAVCRRFEQYALDSGKELAEPTSKGSDAIRQGKYRELFTKKYIGLVILCAFIWFISQFSDYGLTTWITTILTMKGFDVVKSTAYVTLGIAGGIPAWFFVSWAANKIGRKKTFLICGVLTCIFGVAYGAATTDVTLIVFGIGYQFGKFANSMMLALYTTELYEPYIRGAGNSLATSWGRVGSILGPIFFAFTVEAMGAEMTVYLAAVMVIIPGLLVFLLGPETLQGKRKSEHENQA